MVESSKVLYEDDDHQYIWFGWEDPDTDESLVQSNQVLVINQDQGYLFDPGGAFIFSEVAAEVNKYLPLGQIRYLLATHQDPDVYLRSHFGLKQLMHACWSLAYGFDLFLTLGLVITAVW